MPAVQRRKATGQQLRALLTRMAACSPLRLFIASLTKDFVEVSLCIRWRGQQQHQHQQHHQHASAARQAQHRERARELCEPSGAIPHERVLFEAAWQLAQTRATRSKRLGATSTAAEVDGSCWVGGRQRDSTSDGQAAFSQQTQRHTYTPPAASYATDTAGTTTASSSLRAAAAVDVSASLEVTCCADHSGLQTTSSAHSLDIDPVGASARCPLALPPPHPSTQLLEM